MAFSLSVRHKVVKSTESSSFSLRPVLGQSQVSLRSLSLLRIVQTEPKILRLVLRILPLEISPTQWRGDHMASYLGPVSL